MAKLAVAYVRTSSATNVGVDKDSSERQRIAINNCAEAMGISVVKLFGDPAVSGTDPLGERPGFQQLIEFSSMKGITTIMFEDNTRFARDLVRL